MLVVVCGIARATSFTGPASLTLGPLAPYSPICQSALSFASTLAIADTLDGFRVTGGLTISSIGTGTSETGVDNNCFVQVHFARIIDEPNGTVLISETGMSGTVDATGPLQLITHMESLISISGVSDSCFATVNSAAPSGGTDLPFTAGPVLGGPCTVNSPTGTQGMQGVVTMLLNNQPGTITLDFESLLSEAHVQAIPEPSSGLTVFLGLVVASGLARQIRPRLT
jgi:hypothetical protein